MTDFIFKQVGLIGCGLIGSSTARAIREYGLAEKIVVLEKDAVAKEVLHLGLADAAGTDAVILKECDLVIFCTPLGAYEILASQISPYLQPGTIVSDVGSVKQAAVDILQDKLPAHAHFIPGHPIAGTENSGPSAGFAELFAERWFILTPLENDDADYQQSVKKLEQFWQRTKAKVTIMTPQHHDRVLAMTSHLPHLIAYTIVDTAVNLGSDLQDEVIQYSAGGFRDFTRIAASDPTMWRDIFLTNKEAVLDGLQRFTEDLAELQKAIRWGDGEKLFEVFTRTRAVRRSIVDQRQHMAEESKKKAS
ncbi:MAG TPA: prephenate/arogenate dehydrogenase family protein [Alphaproteobacteria bacterium]